MAIDPSIPLQAKTFSLADLLNDQQERQSRQQQMDLQRQQAAMQQAQFSRLQGDWAKADSTEANQRLAVSQASKGDYAGADSQYGAGAGDLGIHGVISGLKAEHVAQARQQYAAAIPVAVGALGIADPAGRKAFIQSHKADLVGAGWHPEEVDAAAANPTDDNLNTIINKARTTEQVLALYDKTNEPFTLGQDQVRYVGGKEVARGPESIKSITTPEGATTTVFGGAGHTGFGASNTGSIPMTVEGLRPAFIAQESSGNYSAVNRETGAMGAYQVMPQTGQALAGKLGLPWRPDLMTASTPEGKAYQDKVGGAAIGEAINGGNGNANDVFSYYYGGSDRSKWGPRTRKYASEMSARFGGGSGGPLTIKGQPKTPESKIPQGYRPTADGNLEPIPGGPADPGTVDMPPPREMAKRNASYPKVTQAYRTATQKIDQQIKDIQTLQKMPGLSRIVGIFDANTPNVSGPARAAQALYDKIVARGQFNELQDMRNSSPTGGALGSVSDSENRTLREAAAALNRNQDEGDFSARLDDYLAALQHSRGNLDEAYNDTYAYRNRSRVTAPASAGGSKPTVSNW